MPDVEAPAAESSPVAEAPQQQPAQPVENMSVPTEPEAYAEWRQSGKLPDKPSKGDSAPSRKSADDESGKGAPVSETGIKRQERANADTRKEELNREIRDLLTKRDELRKDVDKASGKKDVDKAESSTVPQPKGPQRPVKPKQDDYELWPEYQAAEDKYYEDLADYKAAVKLEEYIQTQRQEAMNKEMQGRLNDAKARYGDEAETKITDTARSVFSDAEIPPAIKHALGRSDVLVDALYVLGSDAAEFSGFVSLAKKDPLEALRKWFTVEALTKVELAKPGSTKAEKAETESALPLRGSDGKFQAPARTIREAPAPRTELNGTASPPGDERDRAAKSGDFLAFKRDADRRDAARFRGD